MNPIKVLFFLSILSINHLVHAQIDSATVLKVDSDNLSSNIIINRYDFENINKIPRYFKKSQYIILYYLRFQI